MIDLIFLVAIIGIVMFAVKLCIISFKIHKLVIFDKKKQNSPEVKSLGRKGLKMMVAFVLTLIIIIVIGKIIS